MKFAKPDVLFEDNHLLIVNKEAGELVQGDDTGDESLLNRCKLYIKKKYDKPGDVYLGLVHRIDRPVSGVVIFARTSKAAARLQDVFKEKQIQKIYWALVKSSPTTKSGTLTHFIQRNRQKNISVAHLQPVKESQKGVLHYKVIKALSTGYFLIEIKLETGRHHQIRAQLAKIGCPIVGDLKYGSREVTDGKTIALHAKSVTLEHPVKKETLTVEAPLPDSASWMEFHE